MDANGLRFWTLADRAHWHCWPPVAGAAPDVEFDEARRVLRLASRRNAPAPAEDRGAAIGAAEQPAMARDRYGSSARWDATAGRLVATGARNGDVPLALPPLAAPASDLAPGADRVLYVARSGPVQLVDLRGRWAPAAVTLAEFTAHKLAADPNGGAWVLDRGRGRIARLHGLPLPERPHGPYRATTFRPCDENRDPPRLTPFADARVPAAESAVAIACSPRGRVLVLAWRDGEAARLRLLDEHGAFGAPLLLDGLRWPYTVAWLDDDRVALCATGAAEAFVYELPPAAPAAALALRPTGDYYPLVSAEPAPFAQGPELPPHYPVGGGTADARPLLRLSLPSYARSGVAASFASPLVHPRPPPTLLDSGDAACEWHRVYLEAALPSGTGMRLELAASDTPQPPAAGSAWHLHLFGAAARDGDDPATPHGAWLPQASELPFHPGLLQCPREKDRHGLFTVLVQRPGRRVRGLRGRYLWARLELIGTGRQSPEIAALRAYGSRFSYRDRYLPELYRESVFEPDASDVAPATPPDFLERLLGNFEGVLTPLEDRVAASYLLTDPASAPDDALEWLAAWIGLAFPAGFPAAQRRALLQAAPYLYRLHGTYAGLRAALEIATGGQLRRAQLTRRGEDLANPGDVAVISDGEVQVKGLVLGTRGVAGAGQVLFVAGGAVTGGELVAVENFRMRRVLATILGADLADESHPLLAGLVRSGNSFVGDTLFLGDETRAQVVALFADALHRTPREEAAVKALYDDLAYRVTVLVHDPAEPGAPPLDVKLIGRVARATAPAHVLLDVRPARYAFLAGIASLVAVDTYLGHEPEPRPVRISASFLGVRDLLLGPAALDPRFAGAGVGSVSAPPVAALRGPDRAEFGDSFRLDGNGSRADFRRRITDYIWTWTEPA